MISDDKIKGVVIGGGVALLLIYLYKKNNGNIGSLAKSAIERVPGNLYPLKRMSNEKLEELKENIEDVLSERGPKKK